MSNEAKSNIEVRIPAELDTVFTEVGAFLTHLQPAITAFDPTWTQLLCLGTYLVCNVLAADVDNKLGPLACELTDLFLAFCQEALHQGATTLPGAATDLSVNGSVFLLIPEAGETAEASLNPVVN